MLQYCYGLCLDVPPKLYVVVSGAFSEVAEPTVCEIRVDSWSNVMIKDTKVKSTGVCPK